LEGLEGDGGGDFVEGEVYCEDGKLSQLKAGIGEFRLVAGAVTEPLGGPYRGGLIELDLSQVRGYLHLPDHAFSGCRQLRAVRWPRGIQSIGCYCFERSALTEVDLRETILESLDRGAFWGCSELGSVQLPPTVAVMGASCFAGSGGFVPGLRGLDLSATAVRRVGAWGFMNCRSVREVRLPGCVTDLGEGCFRESGLVGMDLSALRLERMGKWVFEGCRELREIKLPGVLESIGDGCFRGSGVEVMDMSGTRLRTVGGLAFAQCIRLREMVLPVTVREIGAKWGLCCSVGARDMGPTYRCGGAGTSRGRSGIGAFVVGRMVWRGAEAVCMPGMAIGGPVHSGANCLGGHVSRPLPPAG
jgi:hypothetical protein